MPTIQANAWFVTSNEQGGAAQALAVRALAAVAGGGEGCEPWEAALGEALLELVSAQVLAGLVRQEGESLLVRVRGRFDLRAVAAACAGYHHGVGRQGQPATYPVARLLWCLLAGQLLGLSLRGLEVTLRRDQLLRWFCGFALHEPTPDHSTLGRFTVWMQAHGTEQLFQAVLAQIVQDFPGERTRSQIGDTFALHSRAADTDRTALLREVCGRLLRCLEQACALAHAVVLAEMGEEGARLLFGPSTEVRSEQLDGAGRDGRECDTARGAAFCLALVRRQMTVHAISPAVFATPWAGQAAADRAAASFFAGAGAASDDPEQQERRRLDNWLDALDKILADEFFLSPLPAAPSPATPAALPGAAETPETPDEAEAPDALLPGPGMEGGERAERAERAETLTPSCSGDSPTGDSPTGDSPTGDSPTGDAATRPALSPNASRRQGSKNSKEAPGRFRIASAKDLHATYRVHGDSTALGYNVALLTTGDFIHAIRAFTGARADGDTPALLIARQLAQTGYAPAKLIFDRAAGAPKRFADVQRASDGRTQLVAPLLHAGKRGPLFGPDDYHFTWQDGFMLLTCPGGLTTSRAYRSGTGDGWDFRFPAAQCNAVPCPPSSTATEGEGTQAGAPATQRCPLWEKCRSPSARPRAHRTVFVSDYLHQARQAVAYLATPAFREDMRTRAAVERTVAALTRYNGARTARSTGICAADHQVHMAAIGCNLKRWHVLTHQREGGRRAHDTS